MSTNLEVRALPLNHPYSLENNTNQLSTKNAVKNSDTKTHEISAGKCYAVDMPLVTKTDLLKYKKTKIQRPNPVDVYKDYNKEIDPHYFHPQYVYINDVADKILFSQKTISDTSIEGGFDIDLSSLADRLFEEFQVEGALDIVDNNDGTFTSLDNRRLYLAKRIGLVDRTYGVWVNVHEGKKQLSKGNKKRFFAHTWGGAVAKRVNDASKKGYKARPAIFQDGQKKKDQSITLTFDPSQYDYSALDSEDLANLKKNQKFLAVKI